MTSKQLYPEDLEAIPRGLGAVVPDHLVRIVHVSGAELGRRKGQYRIFIDGPRIAGTWTFQSGELTRLALSALDRSAPTNPIK